MCLYVFNYNTYDSFPKNQAKKNADDSWKLVKGDREAVETFIAEHAVVANTAAAVPARPIQQPCMLQVVAHPHTSLGLEPLVHKKPKSTCISTSAAHGSLLNTLGSSSQFPWEKLLDPARNFEDHSFLKLGKELSESMCTFLDLCSQYSKHRTGKSTVLRDNVKHVCSAWTIGGTLKSNIYRAANTVHRSPSAVQ